MSSLPPLSKPLNDHAESSFTLSSEYYLSQEVYEVEKQKIFYRTWQYVAHQSMLPDPGDYITLTLCDEMRTSSSFVPATTNCVLSTTCVGTVHTSYFKVAETFVN
jgi:hypothetical protein